MTRQSKAKLLLTQRALADLVEVLEYSTKQWGKPTAEKYLDDLGTVRSFDGLAQRCRSCQPTTLRLVLVLEPITS